MSSNFRFNPPIDAFRDSFNFQRNSFKYQMTEKDLGSIYDYLRTVKPIKNQVQRFEKIEKAIEVK